MLTRSLAARSRLRAAFRGALKREGILGFVRPPFLHIAPPLVITADELHDGFDRVDRALDTLDEAVGL